MIIMAKEICRDWDCDLERNENQNIESDRKSGNNVLMAGIFIVAVVLVVVMFEYGYNLTL
jgi:hypothetical protein